MELFETPSHYIVQDKENALWASRETGFMEARAGSDLCQATDPFCLGVIHGVIGRIQVGADVDCNWMLLIAKQTEVGLLPGGPPNPIFRIDSVVFLPLTRSPYPVNSTPENSLSVVEPQHQEVKQQSYDDSIRDLMTANLQRCVKHHAIAFNSSSPRPSTTSTEMSHSPHSFSSAVNSLNVPVPSGASGVFKRTFSNLLNTAASTIDNSNRYRRPESRNARRILESLDKLFNDNPNFYYSPTSDITASTWRISANISTGNSKSSLVADDRFFWNKSMLSDLLNSQNSMSSYWIVPVIQGYVEFEQIALPISSSKDSPSVIPGTVLYQKHEENFDFTSNEDLGGGVFSQYSSPKINLYIGIISRRSRHRAGTRYKKRGADELGHCANYVETEQILYWPPHWCSYVIVRGSVPLFWSQSGIQYRPPPKLERTLSENAEAFGLHFERELVYYKSINVVNLLHQSSKEESLCNAYMENVLYYNSPHLSYISFDFNEHCRGMRFENVLILTQNIENMIRESSFTWIDASGRVCEQTAIFRVNCLDCLDRTNIVEAAISRVVLEVQCGKMGILPPDTALPNELLKTFKTLWANNGDVISRQYAGTNALKGDYTRTGEHGITAALKDGMNSANRYYLNQFQDAARQVAVDVSLGIQPVLTERPSIGNSSSSNNLSEEAAAAACAESLETKCENLLAVMDDVRKMLLTEDDLCLGSWLLFDSSDPSAANELDFDVIMVLSMHSVFIVRLDLEGDPIFYYDIPLETVEKVECGLLALGGSGIFKKSKKVGGVKINYRKRQLLEESQSLDITRGSSSEQFCFVLRPANFRLFSGVLIQVENTSDAQEVMTMICECFRNVTRISNLTFNVVESSDTPLKIDRRKTARIENHPNKIMWADSRQTLMPLTIQSPPPIDSRRNSVMTSETARDDILNDPVTISTVVNAPKKIFDTFSKSFSTLLKNTQPVFNADQPITKRNSKPKLTENTASSFFHMPGTALPPMQQSDRIQVSAPTKQPQTPPNYRASRGEEWKREKSEIVKQMAVCRTRIIQL